MPPKEDIKKLLETELARKQAEEKTASELARQNLLDKRRIGAIESLATEAGRLIVDVHSLMTQVNDQNRLLEAFLQQTPLSEAVKEANQATQRMLDHVIDVQNLILELLRFVLINVKVNGEKDRLTQAIKSLPGHPAEVEDSRPEVEHVRKLLRLQHRTLQMLEEDAAQRGIDVPVATRHGIEQARERIRELQGQLLEFLEG